MGDDNRIRLDQTPVDFSVTESGGLSGYPSPNTQSRYDQMRSVLIGLISNQSGKEEPFEKRTGTLWYKKTDDGTKEFVKIQSAGAWTSLADHIGVTVGSEDISLTELLTTVLLQLQYVAPRVIWSGSFTYDNNNHQVPIPDAYQGYAAMANMKAMVWVDGLLVDPRACPIIPGQVAYIRFTDSFLPKPGQNYTVVLQHVTELSQETIFA